MANKSLCLTWLLCMLIRPVCLAPTLIDTTPSNEDVATTVEATEAVLINETDANNSLTALTNTELDSRANNITDYDNFTQSITTELVSQNDTESTSTRIEHFPLSPTVSLTDMTSLNAISDDVSISTFSTLQSRAEISTAEGPLNGTSSSDTEFDVANNSDVSSDNNAIKEQSRHLEDSDISNDTINFNATGRSDTSGEVNTTNSGKRVIFVLPGPVNFSSHAIVNAEDANQKSGDVSEPPEAEFNESTKVSDNSTENLRVNASDSGNTNVDVDGREELSPSTPLTDEDVMEEEATQEPTPSRTFHKTQNSSLLEDVELALSQSSNSSNSAFANYLAELISFYSTKNDTESPEPEAPPSGTFINASQPADSAITEETIPADSPITEETSPAESAITEETSPTESSITEETIPAESAITKEPIANSSDILDPESSDVNSSSEAKSAPQNLGNATDIDRIPEPQSDPNNSTELNEIVSSSLESKSSVSETQNETSTELSSNFNDSSALNEISDASSHSWQDSVTNSTTVTTGANLNDAESVTESLTEINTDAIATQAINLEPSSEYADNVSTTPMEIEEATTEMALNSSPDENLMQRNDISTQKALINENEQQITEISPPGSEDDKNGTTEAVESTTVSGDELFANTPLEYYINSTTITTMDLTTVASIVGYQGSPPNSLLEIYNRHTPKTSCNHQGREYATGQHVEQPDPCHFCVCVNGYLDCYWKNCPPAPEGCMELDFDGVCDRSLYLCPIPKRGEPLPFPANSISRFRREANYTQMTCDILGVQYRVGELIGVASDPCMECRCALDSLYCSPKCCFQPVESGQDPSKNSRANDAVWQPVLSHPLKHLRYDFENQYRV